MQRRTTRSEYELLEAALTELGHAGSFPLVFGGLTSADGLRVSSLRGNQTGSLAGLHVVQRRGLGGQALNEMRPRLAADYRTARNITHDYDREVLTEGVTALLAVPVMVDGEVRGMLYGAEREGISAANRSVDAVVRAAAWLQGQLRARDEAERERLRIELRNGLAAGSRAGRQPHLPGSLNLPGQTADGSIAEVSDFDAPIQHHNDQWNPEQGASDQALSAGRLEELRASYAELRAITASLKDPALIERMRHVEQRLALISQVEVPPSAAYTSADVQLSPREVDVLGYVAIGLNNGEIATELALAESTIKSYLAAAMRKLGQRTRLGAATEARRLGLIP